MVNLGKIVIRFTKQAFRSFNGSTVYTEIRLQITFISFHTFLHKHCRPLFGICCGTTCLSLHTTPLCCPRGSKTGRIENPTVTCRRRNPRGVVVAPVSKTEVTTSDTIVHLVQAPSSIFDTSIVGGVHEAIAKCCNSWRMGPCRESDTWKERHRFPLWNGIFLFRRSPIRLQWGWTWEYVDFLTWISDGTRL